MPSNITVRSLYFDGSLRRSWKCRPISTDGELLTFIGEFEHAVSHPDLGDIPAGTLSVEYYWLNRWYNIFEFRAPDLSLRNYYCNVNMPPRFDGAVLEYIDLDLDVVAWPDHSYSILDRHEFEENALKFGYDAETVMRAESALEELVALARNRAFPVFDLAALSGLDP